MGKSCSKCHKIKPASEFYKSSASKDGVQCECKQCASKVGKKYRRTKRGLLGKIYSHQLEKSKMRGHAPPDYTLEEFRKWAISKPEFHTLHSQWIENNYHQNYIPSCDRLDDYKPYSFDNLRIVTWAENNTKARDDRKNGINNKTSRAVVQLTLDGEFVARHHSTCHAERCTSGNQGNIVQCCRGKYRTSGGFRWQYD